MHGGAARVSAPSRYRQWMTHKLSTWWDQFDTSGCVGCGRCITWCPVGIDITEEAAAIRATDGARRKEEARCRVRRLNSSRAACRCSPTSIRPRSRSSRAAPSIGHFAAGELLAREGAPADTFFAVREGRVALELVAPAARDRDRDARPRRRLRLVVAVRAVPLAVRRARRRARARAGVRRRLPAREDRARRRARLRPDAPLRRPSCSSVCKPPVCDSSMSTATRPADSAAAGTMVPRAYRVVRRRRDTADTWTLTLEPRRGRADWRTGPGSSRCSRRSASARCRSRSAATRPVPARSCIRSRRRSRDTRDLRRARRGSVLGVRGPFGTAWPVDAAEGADLVRGRRRHRPRAAAAASSTTRFAIGAASAASSCSTAAARPADLLYPARARALAPPRHRRRRARSTPRDDGLRRRRRRRHDA